MLNRLFSFRPLLVFLGVLLGICLFCQPVRAASTDRYIKRQLQAFEPVPIAVDEAGNTREFSPEALFRGKQRFDESCLNCHVGGSNVPIPNIPLSLEALSGATPPRDNIEGFVAFMREPMTYDGSDYSPWCRRVPESWMSQEELEEMAAFVIRAAQKVPKWGERIYEAEF